MGKRGHLPPSGNVVNSYNKTLSKRIILFMHYFHKLSSASGGFDLRPTRAPSLDPTG